jgi:hypothetical protein
MKLPKLKQVVTYEKDRGEPAGKGTVLEIGETINQNIHGVEFRWIKIELENGKKNIWPSHRLSW